MLEQAVELHRTGDLQRAEPLYRKVLEQDPRNVMALHMLGCLYIHAGQPRSAIDPLRRAIKLQPDFNDAHIVLGNLYLNLEQFDSAVRHLKRAAELEPDFVPVLVNLGGALDKTKRHEEAEEYLLHALEVEPNNPWAHSALGLALVSLGRAGEAEMHCRRAIDIDPNFAPGMTNLALALVAQQKPTDAEAHCRRAIEIDPEMMDARETLAMCLRDEGRYDEALEQIVSCIERSPGRATSIDLLASILLETARFDDLVKWMNRLMELAPKEFWGPMYSNLAMAHSGLGQMELAVAAHRKACEIWDEDSVPRFNLALCLLSMGELKEGFQLYEKRAGLASSVKRFLEPEWDGSPIPGKRLVVHVEQGLGDTLQYARFLPMIKERSQAHVIFECQPELMDIMGRCKGHDEIIERAMDFRAPDVELDQRISLMSVGKLFLPDLESIPTELPYIFPLEDKVQAWRKRLGDGPELKVGLRWAGNPVFGGDRIRSTHIREMAPLANLPGVKFFSLQKDRAAEQIPFAPEGLVIEDFTDELETLDDTAGLMCALDLVISTCTSVVHLSGALGRPTWVLLSATPDWRWLLDRDDSPWYPGIMKLFRQRQLMSWHEPVSQIRAELEKLVGK